MRRKRRAPTGGRLAGRILARRGWRLGLLAVGLCAVTAAAADPAPPATAQAAHQVVQPEGLRGRLLRDESSPVRSLDATIFTDISPVTASDPAVRLPPDQRIEPPPPTGAGPG